MGQLTTFAYDPGVARDSHGDPSPVVRSRWHRSRSGGLVDTRNVDTPNGLSSAGNPAPMAAARHRQEPPSRMPPAAPPPSPPTPSATSPRRSIPGQRHPVRAGCPRPGPRDHRAGPRWPAGPLASPVTTYSYDSRGNVTGMTLPDLSTRAGPTTRRSASRRATAMRMGGPRPTRSMARGTGSPRPTPGPRDDLQLRQPGQPDECEARPDGPGGPW